jgi:hypothetical protein
VERQSTDNPLSSLTNTELWNTQLALELACGRNHSSLTKKRRQWFCLLAQNLKVEADVRGVTSPSHPFGVGDFRDTQHGAI